MRVLAFEDHYDIEALLLAGGVDVDQLVLEPVSYTHLTLPTIAEV